MYTYIYIYIYFNIYFMLYVLTMQFALIFHNLQVSVCVNIHRESTKVYVCKCFKSFSDVYSSLSYIHLLHS